MLRYGVRIRGGPEGEGRLAAAHRPLPPGGHQFVLYLEGYRTAHYALYLRPGSTFDLHHTMPILPPGRASEPPPFVPAVPPPPPGSFHQPPTAPPVSVPPAPRAPRWLTSDEVHFVVLIPAGSHHIEVSKDGYRRFAIDLAVRDAETAPLNVSLMPGTP